MTTDKYTIDAAGKSLGRIASEAAVALRDKDTVSFQRHIPGKKKVEIINASKLNISDKKRRFTMHQKYSGYPGGRREESTQEVIDKKGYDALVRKAVTGMLPNNRLRSVIIKNLTVVE